MSETGTQTAKPVRPQDANLKRGGKKGATLGRAKTLPLLVDYRAVWRQAEEKDRGEVQKRLRKMLIDDPEKYQDRMIRLEGLNRQTKAQRAVASNEEEGVHGATGAVESEDLTGDVGEGRVTELIERLLGEWDHAD